MKRFLFILTACALALVVIFAGATTWRSFDDNIGTPTSIPTSKPTSAPTTAPTSVPTASTSDPTLPPAPTETLTVTLRGERDIYLEYGTVYTEPGANALLSGEGVSTEVPVQIEGQVDTKKVGTYTLTYSAQSGTLISSDQRNVHVVDTQKPVITLTADPNTFTLPGLLYEEEGFQAMDGYDGDITHKVVRTEADGVVTYTVEDSSGNTYSTTRTIRYFDPGFPEIQLLGNPVHLIAQGDVYTDAGITATDKNDGDLTANVTVEGTVDTSAPGLYNLVYTATNSYGYSSTVHRSVYVLPMEYLTKKPDTAGTAYPDDCLIPQGGTAYNPTGKVIYLTFDDGPSKHTEKLLDILKKYQIKTSFFVINSSRPEMITRAAKEGHTVAIHTYSHNYSKIYASDEAFLADLKSMQDLIKQHTGQTTMLTRFPGGGSNTVSSAYSKGIMTRLTKTLTEMGYTYFDWNVDSDDAGRARTAEKVFENITKGVKNYNNSVVLQHDTKEYSVDAVERLIAWGLVNGYTFKPLTADSPTCHHPVLN